MDKGNEMKQRTANTQYKTVGVQWFYEGLASALAFLSVDRNEAPLEKEVKKERNQKCKELQNKFYQCHEDMQFRQRRPIVRLSKSTEYFAAFR
jgi:hypothetical protein